MNRAIAAAAALVCAACLAPTAVLADDDFENHYYNRYYFGWYHWFRLPRVSISDATASEGDEVITFDVTLDRPARRNVQVLLATRTRGSARPWRDFRFTIDRVRIRRGETRTQFAVPLIDDVVAERDETFQARILWARNARTRDRNGTGTIIDDALTVNLVHINDHHSHLDTDGGELDLGTSGGEFDVDFGGFPAVVSKFAELEAKLDNVVKIHAGDAITGTLFYTLFSGQADADLMNQVCFDMFALGNHEFDDSDAGLAEFLGYLGSDPTCDTPVLAANVVPAIGTPLAPSAEESLIQPYTVLEFGRERVGFIGIDIKQKTEVSSSPLATTQFLDEVETARRYVAELRDQGVENIVLVTHYQYENDMELAAQVPGIDAIVGGDSHTLLGESFASYGLSPSGPYPTVVENAEGDPVCIVQAWQYSWVVGELALSFDQGRVTSCDGTPHLLVSQNYERSTPISDDEVAEIEAAIEAAPDLSAAMPDATATALLAEYSDQVDVLTRQVVGTAAEDLCLARIPGDGRSGICAANEVAASGADRSVNGGFIQQIVTDAFLARAFRADFALQNAGGVRVDIGQGDITIADAFELLPFANTLVELALTGAEVSQVLEEAVSNFVDNGGSTGSYPYASGLRWDLDLSRPAGSRFSDIEVRDAAGTWSPIDAAATYVVVTNSFIASGRDGYLTFGTAFDEGRVVDTFIDYAQGFIDWVEQDAGGAVSVPPAPDFSTQSFVPAP